MAVGRQYVWRSPRGGRRREEGGNAERPRACASAAPSPRLRPRSNGPEVSRWCATPRHESVQEGPWLERGLRARAARSPPRRSACRPPPLPRHASPCRWTGAGWWAACGAPPKGADADTHARRYAAAGERGLSAPPASRPPHHSTPPSAASPNPVRRSAAPAAGPRWRPRPPVCGCARWPHRGVPPAPPPTLTRGARARRAHVHRMRLGGRGGRRRAGAPAAAPPCTRRPRAD
jgi:hypothetical protein